MKDIEIKHTGPFPCPSCGEPIEVSPYFQYPMLFASIVIASMAAMAMPASLFYITPIVALVVWFVAATILTIFVRHFTTIKLRRATGELDWLVRRDKNKPGGQPP